MKNQKTDINIALAFDKNFITPLYVLLTSIFYNNHQNKIIIHSIATGISITEKENIEKFVTMNSGEIIFYDISNFINIEDLNIPSLRSTDFTVAIFFRLFFPFLVPSNVKKLLYIDIDTIVISDLKELYETDISTYPIGAAIDTGMTRFDDPLLLKIGVKKDDYFNSGVLLINTDHWKQQQILEKTLKFIEDKKSILKFPDQDALNYVLRNNYFKFSNKYNFCLGDISLDLPKKEILKSKIVIIHYTAFKPWKALNQNRLRSYYYYYLKKSPCFKSKKYTDFQWTKNFLFEFTKIRIKEFYLDHPTLRNIRSIIR